MLIKVFGQWVNPQNVTNLLVAKTSTGSYSDASFDYIEKDSGTHIQFNWGDGDRGAYCITICDKTPDEVATEINEQLEGK